MSRSDIAIKGSTIGITSQIVNLVLKFIVRTYAIRFLGKELLGLDSVLLDVVGMLSLAELGITSVMLFRMYAPVIEKNQQRISELLSSYKVIYRIISGIVLVLGIIISFFLPNIITNVSISWDIIYITFFLQVINAVASYLLAYQRILLNADQKKHLCIVVDLIVTVVFSVAKIVVLIIWSDYIIYTAITIFQTVSANVYLMYYVKRKYPFVDTHIKARKEDMKVVLLDTKDVVAGKLAVYVYMSTDNLIVSIFMGTGIVGILSNYKYISSAIKGLVNNAMITMQPLIGNYLNSGASKENSFLTLKRYIFVRYLIAGISCAALIASANSFILFWTNSSEFVLPEIVVVLLALDYYIGCVYGPLGEYLNALGMFRIAKYPQFAGAVINILGSLIGVKIGGIIGVLFATVISQVAIFTGYAYYVFFRYYSEDFTIAKNFAITHFKYTVVSIISLFACIYFSTFSFEIGHLGDFIAKAMLSMMLFIVISIVTLWQSDECQFIIQLIKSKVVKAL